jgi:hypothetical protein
VSVVALQAVVLLLRPTGRPGGKGCRMRTARLVPVLAVALAVAMPWSTLDVPVLFDGPLNSPGTLQLLGVCLVLGGLALGYDLLFGHAGLLSFGHAQFIAAGAYGIEQSWPPSCWPAPWPPSAVSSTCC